MSFNLVPQLTRLVVMVARFLMCERKVSNLTYYFLVILFFRNVATGWLQAICFINFFICN